MGASLRVCPATLPKSWKGGVGLVAGCIDGCTPELIGNLKKQRRLADLAGPCQELDSAGRGFAQALGEQPTAVRKVKNKFDDSLIKILLYYVNC